MLIGVKVISIEVIDDFKLISPEYSFDLQFIIGDNDGNVIKIQNVTIDKFFKTFNIFEDKNIILDREGQRIMNAKSSEKTI